MNEKEFAYRIRHHLDIAAERIGPDTTRKLHAARETALSHATIATNGVALAGGGHVSLDDVMPYVRKFVGLLALTLAVAGYSYWSSMERAAEAEEVDTALLADELPINAYLDTGFDAWLKRSSQQ